MILRRKTVNLVLAVLMILMVAPVHQTAYAEETPQCPAWKTQYEQLIDAGNSDKVLTARHRGYFDELLPENSLGAFAKAFSSCMHAVETDVRMTSDGQLVLFHDTSTGKMLEPDYDPETNTGPNPKLNTLSFAQLRKKYLLRPDRTTTHYTVPTVSELLDLVVEQNAGSLVHLEIKEPAAIVPTARLLHDFNEDNPSAHIFNRVVLKFGMNDYPTPQAWQEMLTREGIEGRYLVMPKINSGIAKAIDAGPAIPDVEELSLPANSSRAVAHWAQAPDTLAPIVEVNLKDSSEFKGIVEQTGSPFGNFVKPTSLALDNAQPTTMAQFSAIVTHFHKKLGAFVPVPDYILFSKGPRAGYTVPNTWKDKVPIAVTDAFFNNNSTCCYQLSDRLTATSYAAEQHDWRDNLDWLRSVGANFITADDTDSVELYAQTRGYLNAIARPHPTAPPKNMNSSLYTRMQGFAVPDSDMVRIRGWNGGASSAWGGQVCLWTDPGFYLWTVACHYENPAYNNDLEITTVGNGYMTIRDPYSGQCVYSPPETDQLRLRLGQVRACRDRGAGRCRQFRSANPQHFHHPPKRTGESSFRH